MASPVTIFWTPLDNEAICATQDLDAAGNLIINGTFVNPVFYYNPSVEFPSIERNIGITSADDLSNVEFTITGSLRGAPVSEVLTGPNAETIFGTQLFSRIDSVSVNDAVTNVSVGNGQTGQTIWVPFNNRVSDFSTSFSVFVTGAITYSLESTVENVFNNPATDEIVIIQVDGGDTSTENSFTSFITPVFAARVSILEPPPDNTGELKVTFLQQG